MKSWKILVLVTGIILLANAIGTGAMAMEQQGGGHFIVAAPSGQFGDEVDELGFGLELHYGIRPEPAWTIGLGFHAMTYGDETTTYAMPLVEDFELNTSNNLAGGFIFAQYRPLTGRIQPYAEARAGVNYLWTESKLQDEDWWDIDEVARKTNYDDFAPFWGGGGGLLIQLSHGDPAQDKPGVFLDLKVTYMQGGKAEYLTEGDVSIVNDVPVYSPSETETDLLNYELGVVLTF